MNLDLRPATASDCPALSTFASRVFTDNFGMLYQEADMNLHLQKTCSPEYFMAALGNGDDIILCMDGDVIAAYAKAGAMGLPFPNAHKDAAEMQRFYIDKPYQSKGIGRKLLEAVLALPRLQAAPEIYLGVWEENFRAQKLYEKYGFVAVGEYPYYVGSTVDRELIMRKSK